MAGEAHNLADLLQVSPIQNLAASYLHSSILQRHHEDFISLNLVMVRYRRWCKSEKQLLYDHLERHKGPKGLYCLNRQQAYVDFVREWKRTHSNSDVPLDASKVLSGVKALAIKLGISSYLDLFTLGPVACNKRRSQRTVRCGATPEF
jgi:hypothetical protein